MQEVFNFGLTQEVWEFLREMLRREEVATASERTAGMIAEALQALDKSRASEITGIGAVLAAIPEGCALHRLQRVGGGYEAALSCPANPGLGAPYRGVAADPTAAVAAAAREARGRMDG